MLLLTSKSYDYEYLFINARLIAQSVFLIIIIICKAFIHRFVDVSFIIRAYECKWILQYAYAMR